MSKGIIIVDLDNTIADNIHRLFCNEEGKVNYKRMFLPVNIIKDTPYPYAKEVLNMLIKNGFKIVYLTGRSESTEEVTKLWLAKHGFPIMSAIIICKSKEEEEQGISDSVYKYRCLQGIISKDGLNARVRLAFDNNERTVAMYEKNNIPVVRIKHLDDWEVIKGWIQILM